MKLINIDSRDNEKDKSYYLRKIDISDEEFIQPHPPNAILNQYTAPTCVSHATAAACMSKVYELTGKRVILSPESMQAYFGSKGSKTAWYFAELLCRWGILPKSIFNHKGDNPKLREHLIKLYEDRADVDNIAAKIYCKGWASLRDADEVKTALKQGYRVIASYSISKDFGKVNGGIEPKYPTKATGKHQVMIRGWKQIDGKEHFVIVNSYGERNGDNGLVYMPRSRNFNSATLLDIETTIKPKCRKVEFHIGSKLFNADGVTKELDSHPYIKNNRTYLPLRFVAENLGADVEWDEECRIAYIISEEAEIIVTPDSNIITINGKAYNMDVKPEIINNRIMLPIRYIAEALNCQVKWVADERKVEISTI